jgi:hypothetical protein
MSNGIILNWSTHHHSHLVCGNDFIQGICKRRRGKKKAWLIAGFFRAAYMQAFMGVILNA